MQFKPGDMVRFKSTGNVAIIVRKGNDMPGMPWNDWVLWTKNMYTPMSEERLRMDDVEVVNASR